MKNNKKQRVQEIIRLIKEQNNSIEDQQMARKLFNDMLKDSEDRPADFDVTKNRDDYVFLHKSMIEKRNRELEEEFHKFEQLLPAVNAMGLYNEIVSEFEFENDPVKLKSLFRERLSQVLEAIPDSMASSISCEIKGIDY
jgi:hypothetical protein